MWRVLKLLGKLAEKARNVDVADVMTQSTGADVLDVLKELLW